MAIISKGTTFLLSKGEYSNYDILTICRADADIDTDVCLGEYLKLHPEQVEGYGFRFFTFAKWLIADKKLVTELEYAEWHMGGYSTAKFEVFVNNPNDPEEIKWKEDKYRYE